MIVLKYKRNHYIRNHYGANQMDLQADIGLTECRENKKFPKQNNESFRTDLD